MALNPKKTKNNLKKKKRKPKWEVLGGGPG